MAAPEVSTHPGRVLACVCACTVLVVGFVASINLAVPMLAASALHPGSGQLLWIVDAYVIFFACLVIPAGALGDKLGRKGVLMAGLAVFAAGAMVCALAPSVAVMLIGRAITGVGAAAVLPNSVAVLIHATTPQRRPHAIAIWAAMSGAGGVVGNVGGGAVLQTGSWRWLFVAVTPIALLCAGWVGRDVPVSARSPRRLDVPGSVLLTIATLALLLGIIQGPEQGWSSPLVLGAFLISILLAAGWVVLELRLEQPLLDPRLFAIPQLRGACLGLAVGFFGLFGFFFVNASLLQYGRGFSVLEAGLGVLPLTIPMVAGARYVPHLTARIDERAVLAVAFALIGVALWGLAWAVTASYAAYAVWLVVLGCGATLALPILSSAIAHGLPAAQAGVAGGLQSTTRELGSALGVAVVGTLVTAGFSSRWGGPAGSSVAEALVAHPDQQAAVLAGYCAAAAVALRVVGVVALVAGALVITDLSRAERAVAERRTDPSKITTG